MVAGCGRFSAQRQIRVNQDNRRDAGDDGFTLVEVVVSIVLLGLIAMTMLPMFITGLRLSMQNSDRASATAQVNARIEQARATPTCAGLQALVATSTFDTGRGETLSLVTTLPDGCTANSAVTFSVVAKTTDSVGTIRSSATTKVFVAS